MTQHVVRPEVAAFVAQVREQLADLTPDEVEELVGGLEADLDERLTDTLPGAAPAGLGDPQAYAEELRAAAGLPPRGAGGGRREAGPGRLTLAARGVESWALGLWSPMAGTVRRQPWWPEFRASVVALRPAWWLLRGWVAFMVLSVPLGTSGPLPASLGGLLMLLLLVGISVALGRGLLDGPLGLARRRWTRRFLFGLNVFAVLVLPFALTAFGTNYVYVESGGASSQTPGLAVDGSPVTNVYAFDAAGNPIPVVQLYDQDGHPLEIYRSEEQCCDPAGRPIVRDANSNQVTSYVDDRGQQRWNAFPLPQVSTPEPTYGPDGNATATAPPVVRTPQPSLVEVPPIVGIFGVPQSAGPAAGSPSSTATTSPSPSATTSGSPSASGATTRPPSATRTR